MLFILSLRIASFALSHFRLSPARSGLSRP